MGHDRTFPLKRSIPLAAAMIALHACASRPPAGAPPAAHGARPVASLGPDVGLGTASVSLDGRRLTHTDWATGDLAVRDLETGQTRRLTHKPPLSEVVEFAESFARIVGAGEREHVLYVWDRNGYELRSIAMRGSASPTSVYRGAASHFLAGDATRDGAWVAAVLPVEGSPSRGRISLIAVADGSVKSLAEIDAAAAAGGMRMRFSPDGRHLAWDTPGDGGGRDIVVASTSGGSPHTVVGGASDDRLLDWTPDGSAILFRAERGGRGGAWLQRIEDGSAGSPEWRTAAIGPGVHPIGFAADGRYFIAVPDALAHEVRVGLLSAVESRLDPAALPGAAGPRVGPDFSADGKSLAWLETDAIVIEELASGARRRIPFDGRATGTSGSGEKYLRWSPDGGSLLVPARRTLLRVDVRTGEAAPLVTDRRPRHGRFAPGGPALFYTRLPGKNDGHAELVRLDPGTRETTVLHRSTQRGDHYISLEVSPDGRWLAFSAPEGDTTAVLVLAASGGEPRALIRGGAGERIHVAGWMPGGREVLTVRYMPAADSPQPIVEAIAVDSGTARTFESRVPVLYSIRFHPDGRRYALDAGGRGAELRVLSGLSQ